MSRTLLIATFITGLSAAVALAQTTVPAATAQPQTVEQAFPDLAAAAFVHATPAELGEGVLVRADGFALTPAELDAEIAKSPQAQREQFRRNALFVAEQMTTRALLLKQARAAIPNSASLSEPALLEAYTEKVTADVTVSDDEVAAYYAENPETCGNQPLKNISGAIAGFLRDQKVQEAMRLHVRDLGKTTAIEVNADWLKRQAELATDNPVDRARRSGKPSLVDFGAQGCIPCEKLKPILSAMKTKYEGKANVIFIDIRENQFLGMRYGVQVIPVQVFFDAQGKEAFRHVGFWPQDELESKLAELGAN